GELPGEANARSPVAQALAAEGALSDAGATRACEIVGALQPANRVGLVRVPASQPVGDFVKQRLKLPAQAEIQVERIADFEICLEESAEVAPPVAGGDGVRQRRAVHDTQQKTGE